MSQAQAIDRRQGAQPQQDQQSAARQTGVIDVATVEAFKAELARRQAELRAVLPKNITIEAFTATAISAVRNRPELLDVVPRTLWAAITQAAEDGLMPDKRQGVINAYWDKNALGRDKGGKVAQWIPMLFGIRKRAMELDGMVIDAQVIHALDPHRIMLGDNACIEHGPIDYANDRGAMIACYAIFRDADGRILHREPMCKTDVMKAKAQSKAQTSLMWTTFESEAWRKTAVRRGSKTVPMSSALERIITRDDAHTYIGDEEQPTPRRAAPPPPPRQQRQIDFAPSVPVEIIPPRRAAPVPPVQEQASVAPEVDQATPDFDPRAFCGSIVNRLKIATSTDDTDAILDDVTFESDRLSAEQRDYLKGKHAERVDALKRGR